MDGIEELNHPPVDFVYSDPPWGAGNLKYWQTMNQKMTGAAPKEVSYEAFLARFFAVVKARCKPSAVVFVEYGKAWRRDILRHAAGVGLRVLALSFPTYSRPPLPLALFTMAWETRELPPCYVRSVASTAGGMRTLRAATAPFGLCPGLSILDPCCGMGYTAQLAIDNGMTFYGNELNEKRLSKTLARLTGAVSRQRS